MLLTKLHTPSANPNLVHRSELYEKLNNGLDCRLILVSAPAGFGKTTLISEWINQLDIPAAWISLDKGDNDPAEFLSYLISGIQGIQGDIGESALGLLKSPNKPNAESIASLLINDIIKIKQDFLLVLDDFHLITSIEMMHLVSYILEHVPDNIHLILSTRSDPALPLSRLRSQRKLIEIRAPELSFSAKDISYLFSKKLKIKLSVEDIHALEKKTEGWIAGLQLAALSMKGNEDASAFIRAFAGNNRYIMDYLIEEVLMVQPDDIKEFLLKTSVLEQISAPLCNDVLNREDSQDILEHLEHNNMFVIPLDTERYWYRYHHLFADLLKQRLQLRDKTMVDEIHSRACNWYEQHEMYDLAIGHALESKDYSRSIALLGNIVESMWENGMHAAIMSYGELLPDEHIKNSPDFCLYYAWILIAAGQIQKAKPYLLSAETITRASLEEADPSKPDAKVCTKLMGKIAVATAWLLSIGEFSEGIFDHCETAMACLEEDDLLWYSWAWFSLGVAHFAKGALTESRKAFNQALEYGKKSGNIYLITTVVIRLSENEQQLGHYSSAYKKCTDLLDYMKERGYLEISKAEWTFAPLYFIMGVSQSIIAESDKGFDSIKTAYELSKNGEDIYLRIFVLMFYSYLLQKRGNLEADERAKELENLMKHNRTAPFLTSMFLGWKIYMSLKKNRIEEARQALDEYGFDPDKPKSHSNESAFIAYARLLIAEYKLDEAELLLSELYENANEGKRVERLIEIKIEFASMYTERGEKEKAVASLIEAMEYASGENMVMTFTTTHVDITEILKDVYRIQATKQTGISREFIDKLKLAFERENRSRKIREEGELSVREIDTLELIAEGLMNQEIADKLFISLNTVKTHIRKILLKLEADNRSEAVSKAQKLGIL